MSSTTNWAASTGGAGTATVPTSTDDVFFDGNSGVDSSTISSSTPIKSLDMTGFTGTLIHNAAVTLTIAGNGVVFKLASGMTYTLGDPATSALSFTGTSGTTLITTNGKTLGNITFNGTGGTFQLQDALTSTGTSFTRTNGTFDPNGQTVAFTGAGTVTITGASTFYNLTRTGTAVKTDILSFAASTTITNTLTLNGNSTTNRLLIESNTLGSSRTLTAATTSISNADFRDVTGAGAGNWNLSAITGNSGDCGGNSGITFTTGETLYWFRNAGNWSDSTKWFTATNGSGPGRVPLPQDSVRFDSNSFNVTSSEMNSDIPRAGKNIDWTGATHTPLWDLDQLGGVTIYGSVTLASGMTEGNAVSAPVMEGRGAYTWTSSGVTWGANGNLNIWMFGGSLTFQDTFNSLSSIILNAGTLNANTVNVTAPALNAAANCTVFNACVINMGSGTWTITGGGIAWNTIANDTINANSSTLVMSGSTVTFVGINKTYNNITFSGDNIIVQGNNTFNTMAINNAGLPSGLLLTAGFVQTITNLTTNGASGTLARLLSTATGTPATLKSSGTIAVDYMSIRDSNASGSAVWYAGANSTNVSGNTGWIFAGPGSLPTVSIATTTSITVGSATLNGSIDGTGGTTSTIRGFQYGTSTSYGFSTSTTGSYGTGSFSIGVTDLLCNTTYHVRAFATNFVGTGNSSDATFTTGACPTTWYASPTGSSTNNGSLQYPWSFTYAIAGGGGAIQPGNTVDLRGGTYTLATSSGQYGWTSTVSGTASNPVLITSYPGEWAVLDGNVTGAPTSTTNTTLLKINGNYTWFENFEITNSETDNRLISDSGSNPSDRRANSVDDLATGTKLIDLVIHDTGQGIGGWSNGNDNEYYGNILYNNGWDAPDRLHGHNIYTQNDTGWKIYENNIDLNAFDQDIQMYGSSASYLNNFTFEGNSWANRSVLFGGDSPINNLEVDKNYFYEVSPTLGYSDPGNTGITFYKNYIGSSSLTMKLSKNVTVSHNTIIMPGTTFSFLVSISFNETAPASITDYTVDNNTYYKPFSDVGESFYSPTASVTSNTCNYFWFNRSSTGYGWCGAPPASWQQDLGYDVHGTYTAAVPTTTQIFYRKNKYDPNRENITIYNWAGTSTVVVNPSLVLKNGDTYALHNSEDYFGDVATGTYGGGTITVPMTGHTFAKPIGYNQVVSSTGWYHDPLQPTTFPYYGAFVLIDTAGTTDTAAPVLSNIATSTVATSTATITWDTDEDGTTSLTYGTSTAYGTASTTDDGSIYGTFYTTTHQISLGSLSPNTTYHYRLTDADYSGNTATSSDQTFTTQSIPSFPSVSITAPAPGATVTSTISVTASPTSTAGITSLQFMLDGVPLGPIVTSSPYTISWNTLTASNGSHILTASSTDGNSNVATSSAVTVTVANTTSTPPQSLTATPGNTQVSLSWSAPSSNGGSSLSQYLVYDRFTGSSTFALYATTTPSQTTSTVTSLTNGQSYDFEILAQNSLGASTPSNIVSSTPYTVPGAPTSPSASAGNAEASISFTAPASNGGSSILYYTATSNPGNISATSTMSPVIVTSLTNGQSYTFTVTATNAAGASASSSASNSVTPSGLDPSIASFTASRTLIAPGATSTLSWNTTLAVTVSIDQGVGNQAATSTGSVVVSPTSTTIYTLTATNGNGTSTAEAMITVDGTPPSIPTGLMANAVSTTEIDLSWATSTDNVAVAGYDIYRNSMNIATTSATTYADTGLAAGTSYAYAIDAFDTVGNVSGLSSSTSATTQSVSSGGGGGGGGGGSVGVAGSYGAPYVPGAGLTGSSVLSATPASSTIALLEAELASLEAEYQALLMQEAGQTGGGTGTSYVFTRDLSLWSTGPDVLALQKFLIATDAGPAVRKLAANGSTKTFATLTLNALVEFQKKVGIKPASGYFGSITRAYVNALEKKSGTGN